MTAKNGFPCGRCGTSDWDKRGGCKECKRRWKQDNPTKQRESDRRWRAANPNKVTEYYHRYQQANLDKISERNRRTRQANPEYSSQWQKANPNKVVAYQHSRRTRKTQAGGSHTPGEFKDLCNHYGNKCLRCGRDDVKLTADHIRPVSKGGHSNIDNIQPLCTSCNSVKGNKYIDYRPDAGPLRWLQAKLFG